MARHLDEATCLLRGLHRGRALSGYRLSGCQCLAREVTQSADGLSRRKTTHLEAAPCLAVRGQLGHALRVAQAALRYLAYRPSWACVAQIRRATCQWKRSCLRAQLGSKMGPMRAPTGYLFRIFKVMVRGLLNYFDISYQQVTSWLCDEGTLSQHRTSMTDPI